MGKQLTKYRKVDEKDRQWIEDLMQKEWGSNLIVTRGRLHDTGNLPGIISETMGKKTGILIYNLEKGECEMIALNVTTEGRGIGKGLLDAIKKVTEDEGIKRIWLITTNDNLKALEFYKRNGFKVAAIHKDAINESRKLKPEIPTIGKNEIPIRDEIELEMYL